MHNSSSDSLGRNVPRTTLIDYFEDLARARGQFLVYDDGFRIRRHSYTDVGGAARGFASRLAAADVRKGAKVVFWGENRPEWIVAFWGCLLGGVIVVPIDYRASPEFLTRIATRVAARLILVGEDVPPTRRGARRPRMETPRAGLARRIATHQSRSIPMMSPRLSSHPVRPASRKAS